MIWTATLAAACLAAEGIPDVRKAPPAVFPSTITARGKAWRYELYDVRFPSPVKSRFEANDTVWATLYKPRVPRAKPAAVLLLPVMAAPNDWIEERFALLLVAQGYTVLQLELPFQFRRIPGKGVLSGQVFLARRSDPLRRNFTQAVLDARRALDWLRGSGLVEPQRIAVVGISLGALVGSTLLSVDPTPAGGLLLLGGADFPSMIMNGQMTREFASRTGLHEDALRGAFRGLDPMDFREQNRGKRVFLVNVRNDLVIPLPNALKLKESFPDSRQLLLPLGHYTAMLHLLWMPAYASWKVGALLPE
ncbi:MAG: hypothetical protein HY553_11090 [Elusimicrobia bacterium]|nr:hypothetical protein [Elusimicrobiota bacterium]